MCAGSTAQAAAAGSARPRPTPSHGAAHGAATTSDARRRRAGSARHSSRRRLLIARRRGTHGWFWSGLGSMHNRPCACPHHWGLGGISYRAWDGSGPQTHHAQPAPAQRAAMARYHDTILSRRLKALHVAWVIVPAYESQRAVPEVGVCPLAMRACVRSMSGALLACLLWRHPLMWHVHVQQSLHARHLQAPSGPGPEGDCMPHGKQGV